MKGASAHGRKHPGGRWRLAARLARREVRRHPWRHALVVTMIFVPVLAAFATFSGLATVPRIEARQDRFQNVGRTGGFDGLPRADGRVATPSGSVTATTIGPTDSAEAAAEVTGAGLSSEVRDRLPTGSVVESQWESGDWLVTGRTRSDGRGPVLAGTRMIEAADGTRSASRFVVERGRLPLTAKEILLSPPLAEAGGWQVGSTVTSARSQRQFTVVGIGPIGDHVDDRAAAVADLPTSYWAQAIDDRTLISVDVGGGGGGLLSAERRVNIWLPAGANPSIISSLGGSVDQDQTNLDARVGPAIVLGATAISALVAVVASAAFAIASRRQLRTVGLLSTAGADPATIRAALVLQGAIPGVLAGVGAVVTGLGAIAVANHLGVPERVWDVAGAHLVASVGGGALAVLLGLGAGMIAAWQPARSAARVPVLTALAGRRPVGPVPTGVPVGGIVAWAVGAVLLVIAFQADMRSNESLLAAIQPFLVIAGVAACALGGVLMAPLLVAGVGALAGRVTGTLRLALRGLARHRTQSAATVAAVGLALALPVGLLTNRAIEDRPQALASSTAAYSADGEPAEDAGPPRDVRRSPDMATVSISGDGQSRAVLAARQKAINLLGPAASVIRVIPLVDDRGDFRSVAVIDEDAASEVLAPWAVTQLGDGKALALGGSAPIRYFIAGGQKATFTVDQDRRFDFIDGLDASYLVTSRALGSVGSDRPVGSVAVLRAKPLTDAELTGLRRLGWQPVVFGARPEPTLAQIKAAVAGAGTVVDPPDYSIDVSRPSDPEYTPRNREGLSDFARILVALAGVSGAVALLVLTITLSLRSVDTEPERRAAIAAGAPPARMRRQTALEGFILAGLGALLALPLGWLPVTAARTGFNVRNAAYRSDPPPPLPFHLPGWEVVPILVVPVLVAGLAWLIFPALRAALRRGPLDQVIERW